MALLQISEPGQSLDPHQRKIAIGIDLGTTHSLVAAYQHGFPVCLPDPQGRVLLPSAVRYLEQGRRQLGWDALQASSEDPENTFVSIKRWMGRQLSDIAKREQWPYVWIDAPGMVHMQTRDGAKSPVEISAEILAALRQRAEDSFNDDIEGAVITVPAYFDDAQRQATKDAAQLAGLNVLRLINEPTAAAIAYGLDQGAQGLYAIYDLGGGTFDISILRLHQGVFEVIATGGDAALGGDDIDHLIALEALSNTLSQVTLPQLSNTDKRQLLIAAKACKEQLTLEDQSRVQCTLAQGVIDWPITHAQLTTLCQPLIERTLRAAKRALRDADVEKSQIDGVVMVGGSTRMRVVQNAVTEFFEQPLLNNLNPDEVVALGAAIQAQQLVGQSINADQSQILLLDVIPLSLGVEIMGGMVERIIERNTTIPVAQAQEFTTYQDGQTAMSFHVVQGERDLVADCRSLARFELHGIPAMAAGAAKIRVTFQVDADGLLSASAQELSTGVQTQVTVKPSYGLSDEDIARMLKEGFSHAEQDMHERALREAQVDAHRLLQATRTALKIDGDLLEVQEKETLEKLMAQLEYSVQTEREAARLEAQTQALADGGEAFAARRMNRSIALALTGRNIGDL